MDSTHVTRIACRPGRPAARRHLGLILGLVSCLLAGACRPVPPPDFGRPVTPANRPKVDDWEYVPVLGQAELRSTTMGMPAPSAALLAAPMAAMPAGARMASASAIGFSTGGAKDVGNFRENIRAGFLPIPADIAYEGLFYDYSFDTGASAPCRKLFCPSYVAAVSRDPFSGAEDLYLTVGLNSGLAASRFRRKHLNLLIVLDVSGSMSSPFDQYYYDRSGRRAEAAAQERARPKIRVATESIINLVSHLNDGDRLGIVLFNDTAFRAKPLRAVAELDREKLAMHLRELEADRGTNMEAGMTRATELLETVGDADRDQYENRIIFLTDAQPNTGETTERGLAGLTRANAARQTFTTFIGIGVDFNTALVSELSRIRGANYYAVHSAADFKKRLDDEFDYMVTPLVFDLSLTLETTGYDILKVYGSPEANQSTGEIMHVRTLFPSKVDGGETRGGVVLLKLRRRAEGGRLELRASWEDRSGRRDRDVSAVEIPARGGLAASPASGIRKAMLLSRYADVLLNWLADERRAPREGGRFVPLISAHDGIPCPRPPLGPWERQSVRLTVSPEYRAIFGSFRDHFRGEAKALGDDALGKDLEVLEFLSAWPRFGSMR
jgi:Ca-activated chloride channel family protein